MKANRTSFKQDAGHHVARAASSFILHPSSLRARGLSLVECLISLAITALLLTGVAAAFRASAAAIKINDQFFRASQAARISLNQIMTEVRRCQNGVVGASSLQITTQTGESRNYSLDGTDLIVTLTPP